MLYDVAITLENTGKLGLKLSFLLFTSASANWLNTVVFPIPLSPIKAMIRFKLFSSHNFPKSNLILRRSFL